jgi:hypothetical protein
VISSIRQTTEPWQIRRSIVTRADELHDLQAPSVSGVLQELARSLGAGSELSRRLIAPVMTVQARSSLTMAPLRIEPSAATSPMI